MKQWDEETGLLVFGAGAGGMTAALAGKLAGLDVLLCEKTAAVGGITASSAGTAWVPGTRQSVRAGVPDTVERGRAYLDSVIGARGGEAAREAFLRSGPAVIDALEAASAVKFAAATAHPDYLANHPGAAFGGRALAALPFDGRLLGPDFARIRPPAPEFMVLGGMMVARADIPRCSPRCAPSPTCATPPACSRGMRWTGCASAAAPAWSWATPSQPACSTACARRKYRSGSRPGWSNSCATAAASPARSSRARPGGAGSAQRAA